MSDEQDALDEIESDLDSTGTAYDTEQVNGHVIALVQDEYSENPRDMQDSLWHIAYCERTWGVGDSYADKADRWVESQLRDSYAVDVRDDLLDPWHGETRAYMVYPLQYIDYGSNGARLSVETAPDARDWEQANGVAWVTRAELLDSCQLKHRVSAKAKAAAVATLETEIKYFDAWLSGDVYGYVVIDRFAVGVDSCYGFYGDVDRGYAMAQAREAANAEPPDEPPFPLTA